MARRAVGLTLAIALTALGMAQGARAQSTDPYTAGYCEPDPQTKLLYTNRAYLILPKGPDSPATEARRKGGLAGGKARAKKLSAKKRTAIAKKGAQARWHR